MTAEYSALMNPVWMSGLMSQREKVLLEEGIYRNKEEFYSYKNYFSDIETFNNQKTPLNISDNLINQKMHTVELSNCDVLMFFYRYFNIFKSFINIIRV